MNRKLSKKLNEQKAFFRLNVKYFHWENGSPRNCHNSIHWAIRLQISGCQNMVVVSNHTMFQQYCSLRTCVCFFTFHHVLNVSVSNPISLLITNYIRNVIFFVRFSLADTLIEFIKLQQPYLCYRFLKFSAARSEYITIK